MNGRDAAVRPSASVRPSPVTLRPTHRSHASHLFSDHLIRSRGGQRRTMLSSWITLARPQSERGTRQTDRCSLSLSLARALGSDRDRTVSHSVSRSVDRLRHCVNGQVANATIPTSAMLRAMDRVPVSHSSLHIIIKHASTTYYVNLSLVKTRGWFAQ